MPGYFGDIRLSDTIDIKFCTVTTTGAPTQLAGTPVVSAYLGNSTTQIAVSGGVGTLSVDFDGVTGLNNIRVVASGANGFSTAQNIGLIITTGTVGGTSVVGYEVGSFSIENRSAVMPTTAARTLDVSSGGEAGVDWANVGSPTTTLALTGTTISISNVKKNTALAGFTFIMTDSTNHAPATGKTVTVTRSIGGAAFASGTLSGVTEVSNGLYSVDFASGDLNGNCVVLRATASGCDDRFERVITFT